MVNIIESFIISTESVNGAGMVFLTSIDLYFKTKPTATNNASGINNPGVTCFICPFENGNPMFLSPLLESVVRKDYANITADTTANTATKISFSTLIPLQTDKTYGFVIVPDDPGYSLWVSKQGANLVGTTTQSAGPSGRFNGDYYEYLNANPLSLSDRDLKMVVNIAKFSSNSVTIDLINGPYEILSVNAQANAFFRGGEVVYQDFGNVSSNVTFYSNGTLNINLSNVVVVGTSCNLSIFNANDYITVTDGTLNNTDVIQINSVSNSTYLTLKRFPFFSNTAAKFKKTVVGIVYDWNPLKNRLVLRDSIANSTLFFTNSSILTATIAAGGSGYSNNDKVVISGGGSNINAAANLTTNSTGGIISLNFSNTGNGFTGAAVTVAIQNTTGGSPNGSSASITVNNSTQIGSYVKGIVSKSVAIMSSVDNFAIHDFNAEILNILPSQGNVSGRHVFSNTSYYVNTSLFQTTYFNNVLNSLQSYNGVIASRSNEVLNLTNLYNANSSAVIQATLNMNLSNTNLFQSPFLYSEKLDVVVLNNSINNDANNEWKPYGGNAISKHITTKVGFAPNVFAEDIIVYLDAWRPANTDIKVYAKLWKTGDNDPFDDKYWTPLEIIDPNTSVFSSTSDTSNIIEYTFGLPRYPEIANTLSGFVTTTLNSANINGSNTTFNTDLVAGDFVRIYDPNFAQTNFIVASVNAVTNSTQIIIDTPIANSGLVNSGFKVDKLKYYFTAWRNNQNSNVARYYTSSFSKFDGFDNFQIKVVLLAQANNVVPYVTTLRAIGVSA